VDTSYDINAQRALSTVAYLGGPGACPFKSDKINEKRKMDYSRKGVGQA